MLQGIFIRERMLEGVRKETFVARSRFLLQGLSPPLGVHAGLEGPLPRLSSAPPPTLSLRRRGRVIACGSERRRQIERRGAEVCSAGAAAAFQSQFFSLLIASAARRA